MSCKDMKATKATPSSISTYLEPSVRFGVFLVLMACVWAFTDRWCPIPVAAEELWGVVILLLLPLAFSFKLKRPSNSLKESEETSATVKLSSIAENSDDNASNADSLSESEEVEAVSCGFGAQRIATASLDGSVRLWGLESGECELKLEDVGCAHSSVAFSTDSATMATGGYDGTARVWDAETGKCKHTFDYGGGVVNSIALSPCGEFLLTGLDDHSAQLWRIPASDDASQSVPLSVWDGHNGPVTSVAFSPCSSWAATGSWDATARLYNVASRTCEHVLEGHDAEVLSVRFSPCGNTLATGSRDGTARLWNVNAGWCLVNLEGHDAPVRSIAFSPCGEMVTTGSWDGKVYLFDVLSGDCIRTFCSRTGVEPIHSMAFSACGSTIVTAHGNAIKLWSSESGTVIKMLEGHTDIVQSVAMSS